MPPLVQVGVYTVKKFSGVQAEQILRKRAMFSERHLTWEDKARSKTVIPSPRASTGQPCVPGCRDAAMLALVCFIIIESHTSAVLKDGI